MTELSKHGKRLNKPLFSASKKKLIGDKISQSLFQIIAIFCSLVVVFIAAFILIKGSTPFIKKYEINRNLYSVNLFRFIFGMTWFKSPNVYGVGFIILNTLFITILSLLISGPISILTALYIVKISPRWLSKILNTVVELLAAIPSVIYGLFGRGILTKITNGLANLFGYQSAGGLGLLTSVSVLSIMIIPTITMLSASAIQAVKKDIELGSLALGTSKTETYFLAVLPAAKSGIIQGIILGVGRALGEATAVSLVCGNSTHGPNLNPFDPTSTLTTTMLASIHETLGLDYDIRFSVGLVLIIMIFGVNLLLSYMKKRLGRVK